MRAVAALAMLLVSAASAAAQSCHYSTWRWDTLRRVTVDHREVVKPYAQLSALERDAPSGCSVCREDQAEVAVPGAPPVLLCRALAPAVAMALGDAIDEGARIATLVGWRVGLTRGELDAAGRRTGFSNHSFGIALDVNAEVNGLYHGCPRWSAACRLVRGGPWQPEHPLGLRAGHPLVRALEAAGLRWGGESAGEQKDFMHFSPSGY